MEEEVTEPILADVELAELGLKLARELLDEKVPLEAGISGEAKFDWVSWSRMCLSEYFAFEAFWAEILYT